MLWQDRVIQRNAAFLDMFDVTQMYLTNIVTMTSKEEAKKYDYTSSYPQKVSVLVNNTCIYCWDSLVLYCLVKQMV